APSTGTASSASSSPARRARPRWGTEDEAGSLSPQWPASRRRVRVRRRGARDARPGHLQRRGVDPPRVPPQRRAGREARVVVPHALGLLVHRRARHAHRRVPRHLAGGSPAGGIAMMHRLPQPVAGEWIDRARPLAMDFEGRAIHGFAGDTLTSALAASGVMVTARSFKYHRPRGLVSAAGHDANNLFQVGDEPNQRGDHILARDGLAFSAVNTRGGVGHDRLASLSLLSRFLPVGFYYKVFWGRRTFPWFERTIRRISGLGTVNTAARPAPRERRYAHCDVAVVGAGVSGLSAALAAVAAGARRVVII